MRVIDHRQHRGAFADLYFEPGEVRGKRIERMELDTIGIGCRGRIVGHAKLYTEGGGLVYAVLIEPDIGHGLRAVYLDRDAGYFVQCEVPA